MFYPLEMVPPLIDKIRERTWIEKGENTGHRYQKSDGKIEDIRDLLTCSDEMYAAKERKTIAWSFYFATK